MPRNREVASRVADQIRRSTWCWPMYRSHARRLVPAPRPACGGARSSDQLAADIDRGADPFLLACRQSMTQAAPDGSLSEWRRARARTASKISRRSLRPSRRCTTDNARVWTRPAPCLPAQETPSVVHRSDRYTALRSHNQPRRWPARLSKSQGCAASSSSWSLPRTGAGARPCVASQTIATK